jgi:tol-pal system protein YbgF
MKNHRFGWVWIAGPLLMAGCATGGEEMQTLREQVRLQQKQIVDLQARQGEQQGKIEMLDNSFRIIGEGVEGANRRLDEMEMRGGAVSSSPSRPSSPPPRRVREIPELLVIQSLPASAPPEEVVITPPKRAADLYRSALDSFTQENFQRSVLEFEEFVANHSDHDLADNAQYWIGECYYAQKKFEQAVTEFGRVDTYYSTGNKAPAALLKKGLALKELGRDQEARVALENVISKYPASDEAEVSGKRLSQWR